MLRFCCLALLAVLGAASAYGADAERGRMLYESRCDGCHNSGVHLRGSRKAQSFEAIRGQVMRWNAELGGAWKAEDIDDVTLYLNSRFYFFPCPDRICGAGHALAPR